MGVEAVRGMWQNVLQWGDFDAISFPDPAAASNDVIEQSLITYLNAASELATKMVELSAENETHKALLKEFRAATTVAYVHALDGDSRKAAKALDGVCDK